MPIQTTSGAKVAEVFEKILADARCNIVQSDKGMGFFNYFPVIVAAS